ncbi:MAG: LemA family protein [Flavobacteriia bacterium]|nr:LemA family protein [Flavobacteriia bacterium]
MKKGCLVGGIAGLLALIAIVVLWGVGIYNGIIPKNNAVNGQWGNVETAYQKRADLTDQLVATVKGARDFEQETLTQVIEARAKATSVNIDPSNLDPADLAKFQQAQDGLSSALSRLMVVVERYPDLKSNQNFLSLQASLESMADEIRFEQKKFNDTAQEYNNYIQKIPNNLIAGFGGFKEKGYFKAAEGADQAPTIDFSK